jgi:pimeloyl-ACP methyl ester carboxylesterase
MRGPARLLAVMSAIAVACVLTFSSAAVSRGASTASPKPTIVLVHGAWADASSWSGVISRLQAGGYHVIAPANPLRGLHSDAAYIKSVLRQTSGPLVVVGHSYGGAVITNAAAGDANVKALVYIDAFIPAIGEKVIDLTGKGSLLPTALQELKYPPYGKTDVDVYLNPAKYHSVFAQDIPVGEAAVLAAEQRPLALAAGEEPTTAVAWKTIPSWDLIGLDDRVITPAQQEFMAHRAHATIEKIRASHLSLVSHPGAVATLIERAAGATS